MQSLSITNDIFHRNRRGVFRGGCGLRKILSSLFAGEQGCVPALLVIWPEASQDWSLCADGWGQVFVSKWQAPGQLMPISNQ